MLEVTISASVLATLILEFAKWVARKFIFNDMGYDFSTTFYAVALPVLNAAVLPLLALLLPEQYTMPTDWVGFARSVIVVLIGALGSSLVYNGAIKPLKMSKKIDYIVKSYEETEMPEM